MAVSRSELPELEGKDAKDYKDFWIKDDKVNFYREIFNHTFNNLNLYDTNISFGLSQNGINNPVLISICDSFERLAGDDIVTIRFEGDVPAAKKMIDASIKAFDQIQNININKIKDYCRFYMEQQNWQQKINKHFERQQKINEHFEKNSTVDPDGKVRVKNLSELNRELNKGKPFLADGLAFALTHDHIPTDAEIAEMPKQGETPPLERRDINSKEHIMAYDQTDEWEAQRNVAVEAFNADLEREKELTPKEQAFMNAVHQRKVIADAVKAGTLSCLPGADGYADTSPAYNILTPDKYYHGATLLYLKEHQKQNGFPSGEYITYQQIEKAQKDNSDLYIRKDQKGVSLHVSEENEVTGDYEDKHIRLFNIAQVNKPWEIKKFAELKLEQDRQAKAEYLKTQYGENYKPPEPKPKKPGPEIVCNSTEPEKYLGQYLAAVSMGGKFKVSPEQAAEFSEKMIKTLYAPMEPRKNKQTGEIIPPPKNKQTGEIATNPFSLEKLSINASKECKEFMRDLGIAAQKQNQPDQKQEQTQSRGQAR
jgi:hypothetical protein